MKGCGSKNLIKNIIKTGLTTLVSLTQVAQAALPPTPQTLLPSTVSPGQVSDRLSNQQFVPKKKVAMPDMKPQPEKPSGMLGEKAKTIKFMLNKVVLQGNSVYTDQQLQDLYKNKLHKNISVSELEGIVTDITNYYRNNGYILSRAILPPQHVANGVVYVTVIEGYIDKVDIVGDPKKSKSILQRYGDNIRASRPLRLDVLQRNLRLANEVPGVQVKAVLEPSQASVGASNLNLVAASRPYTAYASMDNYGTRYEGPNEYAGGLEADSFGLPGDSLSLNYETVARPKQLQYQAVTYSLPWGSDGTRFTVAGNNSTTRPGFVLTPLDINGTTKTVYTQWTVPVIRSSEHNLTWDTSLNYIDTQTKTFTFQLYADHLRTVRSGGTFDFTDRFKGYDLMALHFEKGLNLFGATHNPRSLKTSRYGGVGAFSKINLDASRLQPLWGRYSAFTVLKYQYSFNALLSGEQFSFGGSQLGRGYDPSEINGDRGAAFSFELRADYAPTRLVSSIELYAFYDAGVVWNKKYVVGQNKKQSCTSTGFGTRFNFTKVLSGNVMLTQPLTKPVAAMELIGRGRLPRLFFNLTAAV